MMNSIKNINFIHNHSQKKNGFLPINSDVDNAEVDVIRVALVSLASRGSLTRELDTWYTLPEQDQLGDTGTPELHPLPYLDVPAPSSEEN